MERRFMLILLLGMAALAQGPLPPGCTAYPNGCLYSPGPAGNFVGVATSVSYRDVAERVRTLPLYVRVPTGIPGPLPVVIWSPDGNSTDPRSDVAAWSEATTGAGYLTITVAHTPRTPEEKSRFCNTAGVDEETCGYLNPLLWDGPNDLKQVLDWLEEINASGPVEIRNRADMKRITLAGVGYGSNASLSLLGAQRILVEGVPAFDFSDPRPIAAVALSPYGPTHAGMFDTQVGRPYDHGGWGQ
jgi:predicted dienelactone hydrolase